MKTQPSSAKKHKALRRKRFSPCLAVSPKPIKSKSKYNPNIEDAKHKKAKES